MKLLMGWNLLLNQVCVWHKRMRNLKKSEIHTVPKYDKLQNLVILAGPSGCGKTTLARAIYAKTFPNYITSLLPNGIETTVSVDVKYPNQVLRSSMSSDSGFPFVPEKVEMDLESARQIIFHYAINRLDRLHIDDFYDDKTLLGIVKKVNNKIIVINVRVSDRDLSKFYEYRSFKKYVNRFFFIKLLGRIGSFGKFKMYIRYRFFGFGGALFSRWDRILSQLSEYCLEEQPRPVLEVFDVEPYLDSNGDATFRLIE